MQSYQVTNIYQLQDLFAYFFQILTIVIATCTDYMKVITIAQLKTFKYQFLIQKLL